MLAESLKLPATGQAAIPAGRPAISLKAGASDVARVGLDNSWCGRRVPAIVEKEGDGERQLEERSGDCLATDLGGRTDPGRVVGDGGRGGQYLGGGVDWGRRGLEMPLVNGRRQQAGSTSKSITISSKPCSSRDVAGKDVVVKSEGDPQGGRGQERRPKTAAPQPWADNPEGDEELGGGVPQGWGICVGKKEEELPGRRVAKKKERSLLAAIAASGRDWGIRRRPRAGLCISEKGYKKYGGGLTGAAFLQDVAGPTGQEAGFNTRNAASGAAIARRVSKNRHFKGMLKDWHHSNLLGDVEEGLTQVATVAENYQKREQAGLGRVGTDVDIAGPTTKRVGRADDVSDIAGPMTQGTIAGPTEIVQRIRKPWEGKRPAGGRRVIKDMAGKGREVSVGLVRRRETPLSKTKRRTDIGGISKAVVGRAVLSDFDIGQLK
ncbi:hypothetical protein BY996DRAFT_6476404 [Phakopsora pachyrhizi]|nr:hypothetical protein BY996DRAFT_6476404 [Phakopsora pachyrhizi]